jgi:hypothetical protein
LWFLRSVGLWCELIQTVLVQRHAATAFGTPSFVLRHNPLLATLKIALFMVNTDVPTVLPQGRASFQPYTKEANY